MYNILSSRILNVLMQQRNSNVKVGTNGIHHWVWCESESINPRKHEQMDLFHVFWTGPDFDVGMMRRSIELVVLLYAVSVNYLCVSQPHSHHEATTGRAWAALGLFSMFCHFDSGVVLIVTHHIPVTFRRPPPSGVFHCFFLQQFFFK